MWTNCGKPYGERLMADWNYKDFWNESLTQLKNELGEEEYSIWFSKIEYLRSEEKTVYASVPSNFFLGVFGPKYLTQISDKISDLTGKKLTVTLEVHKKSGNAKESTLQQPLSIERNSQNPDDNLRSPAPPIIKKNNPQLQEEFTFETYVVGEVNNYAFNAASAVARNPGSLKIYNPLLIYGGTGLGKTHLMQAIGHYIHQNSDLKILYITGEGFMREFVETFGLGHLTLTLGHPNYHFTGNFCQMRHPEQNFKFSKSLLHIDL